MTAQIGQADQPRRHRITGEWAMVVVILVIGLAIRLYDLTDPPLDFHETRQLGSAIIARGMYYQMNATADPSERELAIKLWRSAPVYEPQILERIVAVTYRIVGQEQLWISRIYTSAAWLAGGVALFMLARTIGSGVAAIISLAFYALLPFGVIASRSFQPDPLMVAASVAGLWAMYRWCAAPSIGRALIAGAAGGAAILLKATAVFVVGGAFLGAVLWSTGFMAAIHNRQVWLMAALSAAPAAIYHLLLVADRSQGLFEFWVSSFRGLLTDGAFYVRWAQQVDGVVGIGSFLLALIGVSLIVRPAVRGISVGMWLGYLAFGLALPQQIMTHDYYHLILVPAVALCLAPMVDAVWGRLVSRPQFWRMVALGIVGLGALEALWDARLELTQVDYRLEVRGWERLADALPKDGTMLALTHAYGFRLEYYGWRKVTVWPYRADISLLERTTGQPFDVQREFDGRTDGVDYFLVTHFGELRAQPELMQLLDRYPRIAEGDGYVVYDLRG